MEGQESTNQMLVGEINADIFLVHFVGPIEVTAELQQNPRILFDRFEAVRRELLEKYRSEESEVKDEEAKGNRKGNGTGLESQESFVLETERMTELVRYEQQAAIDDEYERLNLLICKLLIERLHDPTSDKKLLFFA